MGSVILLIRFMMNEKILWLSAWPGEQGLDAVVAKILEVSKI